MRRDEYVKMLDENRKEAILWLSNLIFDSYDEDDLRTLWLRFHSGEIALEPLVRWSAEALLGVADEYASWDEDDESEEIKVGDGVTRLVAGKIPQRLTVTEVNNDFIHCGPWKFCKLTGAEVDEDLNWGPPPLMTGSYLKEIF